LNQETLGAATTVAVLLMCFSSQVASGGSIPLVSTVWAFKFAFFAASLAARSRSVHVAIVEGFRVIKIPAIVFDLTVLDTKLAIYIIRERLLVKSTVSHGYPFLRFVI
jgi:hypothetical protein